MSFSKDEVWLFYFFFVLGLLFFFFFKIVRFVCESKLSFMATQKVMTKLSDNGTREQVLVWFERTQRRIFYRDSASGDGPVKNIDVSSILEVEEVRLKRISLFCGFFFFFFCIYEKQKKKLDASWGGVSRKDEDRGFLLKCGENNKIGFLADDANSKWIWIDGLVLACNFEVCARKSFLSFASDFSTSSTTTTTTKRLACVLS